MKNEPSPSNSVKEKEKPFLRVVALRETGNPYSMSIPMRDKQISLVLPNGYLNWPAGKPYPDSVKVNLGNGGAIWVNFGYSREFGFYVSIKKGQKKTCGSFRTSRNTGLYR